MNPDPTVLAQVLSGLDPKELARAAARFPMPRASRSLGVCDHFVAMVFAQLTHRSGLQDIETCLQVCSARAYRSGICGRVTRTNLAYANEHRDRRVFAEVAGESNCSRAGSSSTCGFVAFYSYSLNGARVQIWTALCAYLLVTIAKRRPGLTHSLYEILQVVSFCPLEQIPLQELFAQLDTTNSNLDFPKQLEINYS